MKQPPTQVPNLARPPNRESATFAKGSLSREIWVYVMIAIINDINSDD